MKIFVVGDGGPEHNEIRSIHKTKKGALRAWNKLRLKLLNEAIHMNKSSIEEAKRMLKSGVWFDSKKFSASDITYHKNIAKYGDEMFLEMIKNLKCRNPKKIDNYPQETPYIHVRELED